MSEYTPRRVPWPLWPFYVVWRLATFVLTVTGWLVCGLVGLVLVLVGVFLTLSLVGAPIGIPLILLGTLLMLRAIF